jgi:hypothetical protein
VILHLPKANENVRYLSTNELREVIARCESNIVEGFAAMDDYETFVLCQQELSRRKRLCKLNEHK